MEQQSTLINSFKIDEEINFEEEYKRAQDVIFNITNENQKIKDENQNMKRTIQFFQTELEKHRSPPLIVTEILSLTKNNQAIIKLPNQNNFLVNISENVTNLKAGDQVLNDSKSMVILDKVEIAKNFPVENYIIMNQNLKQSWSDIGGLDKEIKKVKEVLELPLIKPELFKKVGITPPKGILLYGPPGTGKTMIAKALAKETKATFIELVGSELVQKFIGEGAKLVKELFELARQKSPTIIFIDEIDSIASKRVETGTSGEREVHRTFMQLLGEIDGFDALDNVKIIAATNRIDILDDAIIRPGRLERHIEINAPDKFGRLQILKIHTKNMKLDNKINLEEIAEKIENFSGADIKALVTEAGYNAINNDRIKITEEDFEIAINNAKEGEELYEVISNSFN